MVVSSSPRCGAAHLGPGEPGHEGSGISPGLSRRSWVRWRQHACAYSASTSRRTQGTLVPSLRLRLSRWWAGSEAPVTGGVSAVHGVAGRRLGRPTGLEPLTTRGNPGDGNNPLTGRAPVTDITSCLEFGGLFWVLLILGFCQWDD